MSQEGVHAFISTKEAVHAHDGIEWQNPATERSENWHHLPPSGNGRLTAQKGKKSAWSLHILLHSSGKSQLHLHTDNWLVLTFYDVIATSWSSYITTWLVKFRVYTDRDFIILLFIIIHTVCDLFLFCCDSICVLFPLSKQTAGSKQMILTFSWRWRRTWRAACRP